MDKCIDCKHYHDNGSILGLCRRFPTYQNRSPNETCGEFSVKAVAKLTPVYAGDFLPVDKPKRMGRPPKVKTEVTE
jgi:hypothetical protein